MKRLFLIGNWKANKTTQEAEEWLHAISNFQFPISNKKEIIICPSVPHLPFSQTYIQAHQLPIKLGAQDVSPFDEGAYTGAISAKQLKEFVGFVIIGHSERREHFSETDKVLEKKVEKALQYNLTPVFCVQNEQTPIPQGVIIVAYEPVFAIGSGTPDTPENAETIAKAIKQKNPQVQVVLYGGSVTKDNVHSFTSQEHIDGVLVGKASLSAAEFAAIITNA